MMRKPLIGIAILGLIAVVLIPVFFRAAFLLHIGTLIFFYIALTSAWNIPAFGGKLSLGHASFFGIGAYSVAILYVKYGVSPWLGLVVAVVRYVGRFTGRRSDNGSAIEESGVASAQETL